MSEKVRKFLLRFFLTLMGVSMLFQGPTRDVVHADFFQEVVSFFEIDFTYLQAEIEDTNTDNSEAADSDGESEEENVDDDDSKLHALHILDHTIQYSLIMDGQSDLLASHKVYYQKLPTPPPQS